MPDTLALAQSALTEYFYEPQEDGSYIRFKGGKPRAMYFPVIDGFLSFTRNDGVWEATPYTILPQWERISGLTHEEHPECYDYVYPADFILEEYSGAIERKEAYEAEHAAKRAAASEAK